MSETAPEVVLVGLPGVELLRAGTWDLSTGSATFSTADLASAVAALGCPAVRRPVLKLGHTDPRFDGEPAVGWVDNLAVSNGGGTLVGDYVGMPEWLGQVLASAYPDRSIEGEFDHRCQKGHTHPLVITAVALLGVSAPGVGGLGSLQDVARLYGVAASTTAQTGTPVSVLVHASRKDGNAVPNPTPRTVAASVTAEDVSRAFYESDLGSSWDAWIEELQIEPLQVIYVNDATGERSRVPVTIGEDEALSFGEPVPVVLSYQDVASVAASARPKAVRYASRHESRPDAPGVRTLDTPVTAATSEALCQRLGLMAGADGETLVAALDEVLAEQADSVMSATAAAAQARELAELRSMRNTHQRDESIRQAVAAGRITPAESEFWRHRYDAAPEVVRTLLSGKTNESSLPLTEVGHSIDAPPTTAYGKLYGENR